MSLQASRPNILFLISDQHRADTMGCADHPAVQTPNLDALAARGTRFEKTYCPQPLCGPSRSCTVSGRLSHRCGVFTHGAESVLADVPTMGTIFREVGYRTAAIGKLHVHGEERLGRDLGFDQRTLRYYTYDYADYIAAVGEDQVNRNAPIRPGSPYNREGYAGRYNPRNAPTIAEEDLMFDNLVTQQVMGFLQEPRERPFFLWCGLEKPHPEWSAPARFHEMYNPEDMPLPVTWDHNVDHLPPIMQRRARWQFMEPHGDFRGTEGTEAYPDLVRGSIAAYCACVSYLDWNVGRILQTLEAQGLAENTIVVYASDHGDNLFEHGLVQKHGFFEGSVRSPLIVSWPARLPGGRRCQQLVNLVDLLPTLLELTEVESPGGFDGASFAHGLEGPEILEEQGKTVSDFYTLDQTFERMLRSPGWKYIFSDGETGAEQLYHLAEDPHELRNLTEDPGSIGQLKTMRQHALADLPEIREAWDQARKCQ